MAVLGGDTQGAISSCCTMASARHLRAPAVHNELTLRLGITVINRAHRCPLRYCTTNHDRPDAHLPKRMGRAIRVSRAIMT